MKLYALMPIQAVDSNMTSIVDSDRRMATLGTAISLMPSGTGGCSTSSGVSDIHDRVMIHLPTSSAINVGLVGLNK
jgi:hypothetical protein